MNGIPSQEVTPSPILIEKALRDSGFDLIGAEQAGWMYARISGTDVRVAVKFGAGGIWLALPTRCTADRIGLLGVGSIAVPDGMAEVGRCSSADGLFSALHIAKSLQTHPSARLSARVEAKLARIPATERTAEVRQRIGQDVFREALLELWEGRCAVTGVALPATLLRASHAKPWAVANDQERLDPFNGLLLAVHLDALFDSGLMTIGEDGVALLSNELSGAARAVLGITDGMRIAKLLPGHLPYLNFHRNKHCPRSPSAVDVR
jgi:hypothetical protein